MIRKIFVIVALIFFYSTLYSYEIYGRVIKVIDGDTFYLLNNKNYKIYKIRIAEIDAPELKQEYGEQAKKFIISQIFGKKIILISNKKDKYDRLICHVFYNNKNIGEELLKEGLAWVWKYSNNKKYKLIELKAKYQKKGLWMNNNSINPYIWRKKYKYVTLKGFEPLIF